MVRPCEWAMSALSASIEGSGGVDRGESNQLEVEGVCIILKSTVSFWRLPKL